MRRNVFILFGAALAIIISSCQSDEKIEFERYYTGGSLVYQAHCQNCHGAKGEGLGGLIPPLTDSLYLKQNKAKLACIAKYGVKGALIVSGRSFDGQMPSGDLAPVEVAKVLTYVANSFGNKLGTITSEQVTEDLKSCR